MIYGIALFLHITGALMLFASISIEWLCIINMRRTRIFETIKESISNYSKLTAINITATLLILIPGIYMMAAVWKNAGWITIAFIGIILLATAGSVGGRKIKIIAKIASDENNLTSSLRKVVNDNSISFSLKMRTAVFLGIIFLMAVKPSLTAAIITLIASVILGFFPLKSREHTGEVIEAKQKINQDY